MFKKKQYEPKPTAAEIDFERRQQAVEYIISLDEESKEQFYAATELIWQGYNTLDTVRTRLQTVIEEQDDPMDDFLEDDATVPPFVALDNEPVEDNQMKPANAKKGKK